MCNLPVQLHEGHDEKAAAKEVNRRKPKQETLELGISELLTFYPTVN